VWLTGTSPALGVCPTAWTNRFQADTNGVNGTVYALASFDPDGTGPIAPSLYAGGLFTAAGSVSATNIARWDGQTWASIGQANGSVRVLKVLDDGSGAALYAGGYFTTIGGVAANHVARWNGTQWSALGSGISGSMPIYDLAVYNDGSGSALYAAGAFSGSLNRIAKWNRSSSSWTALGSGLNNTVFALEVFDDDGAGAHQPELYAAGVFTTAGGTAANRIARWNGTSWSALLGGTSDQVDDLCAFDDGSGPGLYAIGSFTQVYNPATVSANRIAR